MNPRCFVHPRIRRFLKAVIRRIAPSLLAKTTSTDTSLLSPQNPTYRLCYVFHGDAGTWLEMGCELYREKAIFRETIQKCSIEAEKIVGTGIEDYFAGKTPFAVDGSEENTKISLIAETALDLALCDLWTSCGAEPEAIVGICRGEIAAAYAAGALSIEESMAIAHSMASLRLREREEGHWLELKLPFENALQLSLKSPARFDVCVEFSPLKSLAYCSAANYEEVSGFLSDRGVKFRSNPSLHPTHIFSYVDLEAEEGVLFKPEPKPLALPYYSALTGGLIPAGTVLNKHHWYEAYLHPSMVAHAINAALTDGYDVLLNVCGLPTLDAGIRQTASVLEKDITVLNSLESGKSDLIVWIPTFDQLKELNLLGRKDARRQNAEIEPNHNSSAIAEAIYLTKPEFVRDPYTYYSTLRQSGAVHILEEQNTCLILSYKDVLESLKRSEIFTHIRDERETLDPVLLDNDPPSHTRARRILNPFFSSANIQKLEEFMRQKAEQLLEAAGQEELDIVDDFAIPFAELTTCRFLGFSEQEAKSLRESLTPYKYQIDQMIPALIEWSHGYVQRIQQSPTDNLCSQLLDASKGDAFSTEETASLMKLLWIAGGNTTSIVISSCVLYLLRYPEIRVELQSDFSLIPTFIEEVLRFDPPEQVMTRTTVQEIEMSGIRIPASMNAKIYIGAANRDPQQFPEPDKFLLHRKSKNHLAFAAGPHFCIGSVLARLELRVAIETLLAKWPNFTNTRSISTLSYVKSNHSHALNHLYIQK